MTDSVRDLNAAVAAAASELRGGDPVELPALERPPKAELGDYSTNAAMLLAPILGAPPREIAERLGGALTDRLGAGARAGRGGRAGLPQPLHGRPLAGAARWRTPWRRARATAPGSDGERVNVEFVSANPTGPITVASARHAAYGDCAVPDPGVRRQRGRPRVLRERPRRPDPALRRVDPRARRGRGAARGRLPGRLRDRPGRNRSTAPHELDDDELGQPRGRADAGGRARHARALPGAHGPLRLRAGPVRRRRASRPRSSCSRSASTSTRWTAPCGCAPPPSATTRTGC